MDLTSYPAIQSNLFVEITIYDDAGVDEVLRLSDYWRTITIDGQSYTGLGSLMSITESSADLRITPFELSIGLSGIPNSLVSTVLSSNIKGSVVQILRAIFNPVTGTLLAITGNPAGRFDGIVNNFTLTDDMQEGTKQATSTITLICTSNITQLEKKISGRATNPDVQQTLYPGDLSMNRVPSLANSNYNFGAPR